jgi:hypothetical protein
MKSIKGPYSTTTWNRVVIGTQSSHELLHELPPASVFRPHVNNQDRDMNDV